MFVMRTLVPSQHIDRKKPGKENEDAATVTNMGRIKIARGGKRRGRASEAEGRRCGVET